MLLTDENLLLVTFDPMTDTARLAGFIEHYALNGSGAVLLGGLSNNLNNGFGRVTLQQPDVGVGVTHVLADEVLYDDLAPWPISLNGPDGLGESLHRQGTSLYGNDAVSWLGAAPSPGVTSFTLPESADFNSDGSINGSDFLAWQRGFGMVSPNASKGDGDADNDFDVDSEDLSIWNNQYGTFTIAAARVEPTPLPSLNTGSPNSETGQPPALVTSAKGSSNLVGSNFLSPLNLNASDEKPTDKGKIAFEETNYLPGTFDSSASNALTSLSSTSVKNSSISVDRLFEEIEENQHNFTDFEWNEEWTVIL